MLLTQRSTALLLALACQSAAALAQTNPALADTRLVERFDQMVAQMPPTEGLPPPERLRTERSAGDVVVKRRLNVKVNFPGNVRGAMYGGYLDGEAAVFTRSGRSLDVTVIRDGDAEVMSFVAPADGPAADATIPPTPEPGGARLRRSVGPGHFEDPAAHHLHFHFMKHDDLSHRTAQDIHAHFVAWWLADMALNVLPVETLSVTYEERVPWVTSMAYGEAGALPAFERALKLLDDDFNFNLEGTYKNKFILLTAQRPVPGAAGVAFEGGNEAIASISGRMRIIAHEIGHMLGATHLAAESRGWWGCETNMFAVASKQRRDCLEYTAANQRAIRSYMRHGPDMSVPRRMADAPMPE